MKWIVSLVGAVAFVLFIGHAVTVNNTYNRRIGGYWNLSVKASTLDLKSDYLNRFVAAVEAESLSGYDALFLKNPNNGVEQNIVALRSLQTRMTEIRGMDVTSFQYQQAIAQITAQEQDEAHELLSTIKGRWYLTNHPMLWGWIGLLVGAILLCVIAVGPIGAALEPS